MNIKKKNSFLSELKSSLNAEEATPRLRKLVVADIENEEEEPSLSHNEKDTDLDSIVFNRSTALFKEAEDAYDKLTYSLTQDPNNIDRLKDTDEYKEAIEKGTEESFLLEDTNKRLEKYPEIKKISDQVLATLDGLISLADEDIANFKSSKTAAVGRGRNRQIGDGIASDPNVKKDVAEKAKELDGIDPQIIKDHFIQSKHEFMNLMREVITAKEHGIPNGMWSTLYHSSSSPVTGLEVKAKALNLGPVAKKLNKFLENLYVSARANADERKISNTLFSGTNKKGEQLPSVDRYSSVLNIGKALVGNTFGSNQVKSANRLKELTSDDVINLFNLDAGVDEAIKNIKKEVDKALDPKGTGKPKLFGKKYGDSFIKEDAKGNLFVYNKTTGVKTSYKNTLESSREKEKLVTFIHNLEEQGIDKNIIDNLDPYIEMWPNPGTGGVKFYSDLLIANIINSFSTYIDTNAEHLKSLSRKEVLAEIKSKFGSYKGLLGTFQHIAIGLNLFNLQKTAIESSDTKIENVDDGVDIRLERTNRGDVVIIENNTKNYRKEYDIQDLFNDNVIDTVDVFSKAIANPSYLETVYKNILEFLIYQETGGDLIKLNNSSYSWSRHFDEIASKFQGSSPNEKSASYYKGLIKSRLIKRASLLSLVGISISDPEDPLGEMMLRVVLNDKISFIFTINRVSEHGFKISRVKPMGLKSLSDEEQNLAAKIVSALDNHSGFYDDPEAVKGAMNTETEEDLASIKRTFSQKYLSYIDNIITKIENGPEAKSDEKDSPAKEDVSKPSPKVKKLERGQVLELKRRHQELIEKDEEEDLTPAEEAEKRRIARQLGPYLNDPEVGSDGETFEEFYGKYEEILEAARAQKITGQRADWLFQRLLLLDREQINTVLTSKEEAAIEAEKAEILKEIRRAGDFSKLVVGYENMSLQEIRDDFMYYMTGGKPNDSSARIAFLLRNPEHVKNAKMNLKNNPNIRTLLMRNRESYPNIDEFLTLLYGEDKL